MKTRKTIVMGLLLVVSAGLGGCAPTLRIRNQDAAHPQIMVSVNQGERVEVKYGESLSLTVPEGMCRVSAQAAAQSRDLWSEGGQGWDIYVEDDAELILLVPPPAPSAPAAQSESGR